MLTRVAIVEDNRLLAATLAAVFKLLQGGCHTSATGSDYSTVRKSSSPRPLNRSLGPALAVWLCSTVWLGVAPALVSLLGVLQWKSLPFPDARRIVQVNAGLTVAQALSGSDPFAAISAFDAGWLVAEGPAGSAAVISTSVDSSFFRVFETRASSGRVFSPGNESSEVGTAILAESLSQRLLMEVS